MNQKVKKEVKLMEIKVKIARLMSKGKESNKKQKMLQLIIKN